MQLLVNLDVDDLAKAIAFYGAACGLRVGRRFGSFGVEMLGASAPIYLLAKEAGSPAAETTAQRRSYARHWTPVHLDFVVEDVMNQRYERHADIWFESLDEARQFGRRRAVLTGPYGPVDDLRRVAEVASGRAKAAP